MYSYEKKTDVDLIIQNYKCIIFFVQILVSNKYIISISKLYSLYINCI